MSGVKPSEWSAATITALHARLQPQACIIVETTDDPKGNGAALIAAYTAAKALTPNGAALLATNRACVIIPPGKYDLDHGVDDACVPLELDTEFVDIIGLTTDRALQHIYGTPEVINSGVIVQTANDVHISNLTVEILTEVAYDEGQEDYPLNWDNTDSATYFPSTNLSNTVVDNCAFVGGNIDWDNPAATVKLISMRYGDTVYSGTFINCIGGYRAFGGGGTASGTFTSCIGGFQSFGGAGTASGTFISCIGGIGAFGGGTASGTFKSCLGGDESFGGAGTASGIFTNCIGGDLSFGGGALGVASGTFISCIGSDESFGSTGTASGTFLFCKQTSERNTLTASVATVEIAGGGTSYEIDDELTIVGGTGIAATLKVIEVNAGIITNIEVLTVGAYTSKPNNPVATTGHTGDATFNLTWNEGHVYGCIDSTGFIAEKNWDDPA